MRVVGLGQRIEKKFYLLIPVFLVNVAGQTIVTSRDQLRPWLDRMFAQLFLQQLIVDSTAPELVGFGFIFRPGRFLPSSARWCRCS